MEGQPEAWTGAGAELGLGEPESAHCALPGLAQVCALLGGAEPESRDCRAWHTVT